MEKCFPILELYASKKIHDIQNKLIKTKPNKWINDP